MEGWIMGDIRTSSLGSTPFGTSETRPANPSIGQTYFNGTLGVQEIYTASGWLPATGANDFNVTLNGPVTTSTFTKEYFAGAYTIASALLDSSYDIYVYDTLGNLAGYTKSPSLNATGNFNKIVVIGGSTGDLLSFSYKTTFTATTTTSQVTAGAFITSVTPTALNTINDSTTVVGGNFASNVAVYFVGSDNVEIPAKSIVRTSSSELIVTRPDVFATNLGTYKVVVENPGITRPTGSSLHILNNAITAGTTPNWTTATTLPEIAKNIAYTTTLVATDSEGTDIDYSIISGTLPAGITLNNETGVLSGTYTGSDFNTTNLLVRAVDTGGNTVDRTFRLFSLNPVWNTGATLSSTESGVAYSNQLSASDDNSITYSLISGSFPTGISLSSSGLISGTSNGTAGTNYSIVIRATDSSGNYTDKAFTLLLSGFIPLTWTSAGGASYSITGNGTTTSSVYKTNSNESWAHNVYNNTDIYGPFSFEWSAQAASNGGDDGNSYKMIGVGRTSDIPRLDNQGYRAFYTLYPHRTDTMSWYSTTTDGNTGISWVNGDIFVFSVFANGDIKAYKKSNGVLYKEWNTGHTGPWRVGASIYSINAPKGGFADARVKVGQIWNGTQYV
jgi:hypothetical protein